ncbi:hypothetical protein PVAP13_9NG297800 [Panicum virgatum]|uniref:Uncharacterized protein n=1 Tax=Panicum virgatum TaxID=38727 RepID=A0A8T0MJY9_PANVG|nr:hypothetical protein PVAP13_9NG297800 [Panicum virgatum]
MIYKGQYEGLDYPAIVLFIAQMMTQPPAKPTPPSSSQTVGDANPVIMSNCNSKFKDNYRSCRTAQTYGSTWDLNFCRARLRRRPMLKHREYFQSEDSNLPRNMSPHVKIREICSDKSIRWHQGFGKSKHRNTYGLVESSAQKNKSNRCASVP